MHDGAVVEFNERKALGFGVPVGPFSEEIAASCFGKRFKTNCQNNAGL